jgi:spermidine/putrescine-binding protein
METEGVRVNRRQLLAALAASPFLPARGAGQQTSQLAVMTWGGSWGEAQAAGTDAMFTQETGIKAVQERNVSPGDRVIKAKINAGNQIYDIMWLTDALTAYARKESVLAPLDRASPRLGNLNSIYPRFLSPDFVSIIFSAAGVAYNPKYVKDPLTSFADLWRPELKGRIVLPAFPHSFGPAVVCVGALAAGRPLNDAEAGFGMLEKIAKLDPIWAADTDALTNAYTNEEGIAGILYRSQAYTVATGGTKVEWVFPREGAILISWGLGIVKGTKNLEAAERYVNIACDPAAQGQFTRTHNYPGTNRMTADMLPKELRGRARWSDEEIGRLLQLDHEFLAANRAGWSERWNRIVAQ